MKKPKITLEEWCKQNNRLDLLSEWHPTKNTINPNEISPYSSKKVWWLKHYDDAKTGRHFDFEWETIVKNRLTKNCCPYFNSKKIWYGFNDFETWCKDNDRLNLLNQWNYEKNSIKPSEVSPSSQKTVWWKCENGHEWQAIVGDKKKKNSGCPYCAHRNVTKGVNDFASQHPELLSEWDYEKNTITPDSIASYSHTKVWWKCSKCEHEWETTVRGRSIGHNCPNCVKSNRTSFAEQAAYYYIKPFFSDAVNSDMHLGMELDIYIPSIQTAIEYDGEAWHNKSKKKELDKKKNQLCIDNGIKLIRIIEPKIKHVFDDCTTLKREDSTTRTSLSKVIVDLLHTLGIYNNIDIDINKDAIQITSQYASYKFENSLAFCYPDIAKELHPTKNGSLTADKISKGANFKVWWKCPKGHEYQKTVYLRTGKHHYGCPMCSQNRRRVMCVETNEVFENASVAARSLNLISPSHIYTCCEGKQKTSCGYHWKYID